MLHLDRRRACSFGADAERYDRARPGYPAALIDNLVGSGPRRVLDVGCGSGIAARQLAARGCQVLGIEPDPRMAEVARASGLDVESGTFEAWEAGGRVFDLLTSGQAWHWVDPEIGARKAASVLAPGGRLALFWNVGVMPPELKPAMEAVYQQLGPGLDQYSVSLGNAGTGTVSAAAASLESSGRFASVEVRTFPHAVVYTTAAWLDHLPTHSDHASLTPDRLAALLAGIGSVIDSVGGRFTMAYDCWLVDARAR